MSRRYWALVLNYKHWRETTRCAESLLSGQEPPERLVICENGSADGSLEELERWALGHSRAGGLLRLTRVQAESGAVPSAERVILINIAANLGYAGGNNVGLHLALAAEVPFVWILNNDTTVFPDAATALLDHMERHGRCGLCGALTRYMDDPEVVQCLGGGWYDPIWGRGGLHGDGMRLALGDMPEHPPAQLGYVNGASVFARREFLSEVGLMEDAYFLYCEELDWAERALGKWDLCWAPGAQILHAEGLSTGVSNRRGLGHGARRAYTLLYSRLLYTLKFHPFCLPTILVGQLWALLRKCITRTTRPSAKPGGRRP